MTDFKNKSRDFKVGYIDCLRDIDNLYRMASNQGYIPEGYIGTYNYNVNSFDKLLQNFKTEQAKKLGY